MVNTWLGGHRISIRGITQIIGTRKNIHIEASVCEIGCGGGDNLKAIAAWCSKHHIAANFTGIDIKKACVELAAQQYPEMSARWIHSDYAAVEFTAEKPAVIFSSLFCHHFKEEQLVSMLKWMNRNSSTGFFINDLQRNPLAYYSIKWITHFFSKSYLVKNDASLSVARSFRKNEWRNLFHAAGITNYSIQWRWAFRYLIVCKK